MAKLFHHHTLNNLVRVADGSTVYVDASDCFAADNGTEVPAILAGAIERIYEPDVRHAISNGSSVIGVGPQPWPFGDTVIAAVATLLAAQAKRTAPQTSVPRPAAKVTTTGKSTGTTTVAS